LVLLLFPSPQSPVPSPQKEQFMTVQSIVIPKTQVEEGVDNFTVAENIAKGLSVVTGAIPVIGEIPSKIFDAVEYIIRSIREFRPKSNPEPWKDNAVIKDFNPKEDLIVTPQIQQRFSPRRSR